MNSGRLCGAASTKGGSGWPNAEEPAKSWLMPSAGAGRGRAACCGGAFRLSTKSACCSPTSGGLMPDFWRAYARLLAGLCPTSGGLMPVFCLPPSIGPQAKATDRRAMWSGSMASCVSGWRALFVGHFLSPSLTRCTKAACSCSSTSITLTFLSRPTPRFLITCQQYKYHRTLLR